MQPSLHGAVKSSLVQKVETVFQVRYMVHSSRNTEMTLEAPEPEVPSLTEKLGGAGIVIDDDLPTPAKSSFCTVQ